jgi:hypothetical protein
VTRSAPKNKGQAPGESWASFFMARNPDRKKGVICYLLVSLAQRDFRRWLLLSA